MNIEPMHLSPRSVNEALTLLKTYPDAIVIGGGTAAQLTWPGGRAPVCLIDLQALIRQACLQPIHWGDPVESGRTLVLSAFASLEALRRHPLVQSELPELANLLSHVASAPVRRLGTLGGNLCWSGGDLGCVMLALGARFRFALAGERAATSVQELPLHDVLTDVIVPTQNYTAVFNKVGFRAEFSPTLVTIAIVRSAADTRVAAGGGPTAAQRLPAVERLVNAGGFDVALMRQAVRTQLRTTSDALGTAAERQEVAARTIAGYLSLALAERRCA